MAKKLLFSFLLIGLTACVDRSGFKGQDMENQDQVLALVNGSELKARELWSDEGAKRQLESLNEQIFDLKRQALDQLIDKKLIEDESRKQGSTPEKLLSQFDSIMQSPISPEEVSRFLKSQNVDEKKLSKQVKESVPNIIRQKKIEEARDKFVLSLRQRANIKLLMKRNWPAAKTVGEGSMSPVGPSKAKVAVVVFSDFQCPACAQLRTFVDDLKAKYKDKIRLHFRHFPLTNKHPEAFGAAVASVCAQDQNKFWDYHNILFENQGSLGEKSLIDYAKKLGLDEKKFMTCLKDIKSSETVRKDMEDGQKLGILGTPSIFINGVTFASPNQQKIDELIDELLATK